METENLLPGNSLNVKIRVGMEILALVFIILAYIFRYNDEKDDYFNLFFGFFNTFFFNVFFLYYCDKCSVCFTLNAILFSVMVFLVCVKK